MKFREIDFEMSMLLLGAILLMLGAFSTFILTIKGNFYWILTFLIAVIGFILIKIDWKDGEPKEDKS